MSMSASQTNGAPSTVYDYPWEFHVTLEFQIKNKHMK